MAGGADAGRSPATCSSAARRPTRRSASCCCAPLGAAAPRRRATRPPPTSSARWRSARRATTAGGCSRSSARSRSTPACRTRGGGCARRCARCATATSRIDVLTRLAALNLVDAGDDGLARSSSRSSPARPIPPSRLAVEAAALDALMIFPERHAERARRVAAIDLAAIADPLLERVVLAHRAWVGVELGAPTRRPWRRWRCEALDGGLLLREAHRRSAYALAARVLVMTDHPDAGARDRRPARRGVQRGSLRLRVAAAWYAAEHALRTRPRGRGREPRARSRSTSSTTTSTCSPAARVEVLVCALAERGAFDEARELLRERGLDGALGSRPWEIGVRHARARLWLAEGDFERAHAEALARRARCARSRAARTRRSRRGARPRRWRSRTSGGATRRPRWPTPSWRWPSASARRCRSPRALHARAVAEPDPRRARRALRARAGGRAGAPARLEAVRAAARARQRARLLGRRVEARDALRPALADADAAGAVLLAQRARRELVATGLRPRQAAIEGTAALTPRQRQICELAAVGKGNRAIAQELFLSIKTVETHLAAGYRKLGVNTRAELAAELAA